MRRGLMGWNPEELPKAALEARIACLRAELARNGFDGALFYTNLVQPSAVTWLTGFTPYWSDGMLLLLREGAPVFATALSKRVANWIRSTDGLSEIVNTPKPGAAVGQRVAAAGGRRIGVLDYDALPAGLDEEITAAAPGVVLADLGRVFAQVRGRIDAAERGLIARADQLARTALDQVGPSTATDAGVVAGLVEKQARLGGAEEAYIAVAADLDRDRRLVRVSGTLPLAERFAVRASIAYKGSWVRRIRSFSRDDKAHRGDAAAEAWLTQVASAIEPGRPLAAQIGSRANDLPGAKLLHWSAESCLGSYPLSVVANHGGEAWAPPAGSFLVLTVELALDRRPWLGAMPALVG